MKHYLIKIIVCAIALGLFEGFAIGQTEAGEISLTELENMKGTFFGSLTIVTEDTTFGPIISWGITDSSIVFCDYGANYVKKRSIFHARTLGSISTYVKPNTVSIPFESIEKIIYEEPSKSDYSEHSGTSKETPARYGGEVNVRSGELTLAFFNEVQFGLYRMVVKVNTTFLQEGGDTRISSSGLYTMGYMLAAGIAMGTIHREDMGESGQTIYALILGSPLLLTNAEHHLFILNAPGYYQSSPFALSSFVAFRTDYFGPKWLVYSPAVGMQVEFNLADENGNSFGNSLALKAAYEFTYDGKKGDYWTSRPLLALEVTF